MGGRSEQPDHRGRDHHAHSTDGVAEPRLRHADDHPRRGRAPAAVSVRRGSGGGSTPLRQLAVLVADAAGGSRHVHSAANADGNADAEQNPHAHGDGDEDSDADVTLRRAVRRIRDTDPDGNSKAVVQHVQHRDTKTQRRTGTARKPSAARSEGSAPWWLCVFVLNWSRASAFAVCSAVKNLIRSKVKRARRYAGLTAPNSAYLTQAGETDPAAPAERRDRTRGSSVSAGSTQSPVGPHRRLAHLAGHR